MKLPYLHSVCGLAVWVGLSVSTVMAQDANDRIRVEVSVQSGQDRKDLAKTTTDTVTQHKTLNIILSGKAKSQETRTGKWIVYGRSLKGNDVTVLESGEIKVDFTNGIQRIKTKTISTTYTREHSTVSNNRNGKYGRVRVTKIPGMGTKYVGYSIVVKDGDKVVGQTADPMGIEERSIK